MRPGPLPSYQIVRERLDYDPQTGVFTWKVHRGGGCRRGEVAGTNVHGYVLIGINRQQYHAQRLAWLYMTGRDPGESLVDHRDLDTANNRWANLRLATYSQNKNNGRLYRTNKSGAKGVRQYHNGRWLATITANGKRVHLGYRGTKQEAIALREAASKKLHGEFARAA